MDAAKRASWQLGIERLREMTPDETLRAASEQRRIALEFLRGGIRAQEPGLTDDEVEDRVGEAVFGTEVWGDIRERRRRSHPCR